MTFGAGRISLRLPVLVHPFAFVHGLPTRGFFPLVISLPGSHVRVRQSSSPGALLSSFRPHRALGELCTCSEQRLQVLPAQLSPGLTFRDRASQALRHLSPVSGACETWVGRGLVFYFQLLVAVEQEDNTPPYRYSPNGTEGLLVIWSRRCPSSTRRVRAHRPIMTRAAEAPRLVLSLPLCVTKADHRGQWELRRA